MAKVRLFGSNPPQLPPGASETKLSRENYSRKMKDHERRQQLTSEPVKVVKELRPEIQVRVSLQEYLRGIKEQPPGRRMFKLVQQAEGFDIEALGKSVVYFPKKDAAKEVARHLLEHYHSQTLISPGPDHPSVKNKI